MEHRYSVYDDNSKQFIATRRGKAFLTTGKGYNRDMISRWSLSKARSAVKNYKTMNWLYPEQKNGNPTRKALRILRVYSEEWSELTGIRRLRATLLETRTSTYGDWY